MEFKFDLELIRSNPHLCLAGYRQLDSASAYASFIKELHEGCCFSRPMTCTLAQRGEYQFACARGSQLRLDGLSIPIDFGGKSGLVEWLFVESHNRARDKPNPLLSFEGLALIIFLTEWCMADLSTEDEHFRQMFHQGKAVTICERRTNGERPQDTPMIQLQYLIAPPQFRSRVVSSGQISDAISYLREHNLISNGLSTKNSVMVYGGFEVELASEV